MIPNPDCTCKGKGCEECNVSNIVEDLRSFSVMTLGMAAIGASTASWKDIEDFFSAPKETSGVESSAQARASGRYMSRPLPRSSFRDGRDGRCPGQVRQAFRFGNCFLVDHRPIRHCCRHLAEDKRVMEQNDSIISIVQYLHLFSAWKDNLPRTFYS